MSARDEPSDMVRECSSPGAVRSVSWWRRALMVAVTVGLTWMCASCVFGSATMLRPADMEPMPASMDLAVGDVEQVASAVPALMAGMCDGVCASVTTTGSPQRRWRLPRRCWVFSSPAGACPIWACCPGRPEPSACGANALRGEAGPCFPQRRCACGGCDRPLRVLLSPPPGARTRPFVRLLALRSAHTQPRVPAPPRGWARSTRTQRTYSSWTCR